MYMLIIALQQTDYTYFSNLVKFSLDFFDIKIQRGTNTKNSLQDEV